MSRDSFQSELWCQLQWVANVIAEVRSGTSASTAILHAPSTQRPGVQAVVFRVLRTLGRAIALRKLLAQKVPSELPDALLCSALSLLSDKSEHLYDEFTLVNQAVEAAKRTPALRKHASFINACLRRYLRERDALDRAIKSDLVALWNHPKWWIERLQSDYPNQWQQLLNFNNHRAPMTLRVNSALVTTQAYLERLAQHGLPATSCGPFAISLHRPVPVEQLPGFETGWVSVQDAASQIAAPLLLTGLRPDALRVLDACAAPGGKTAHLLELGVRTVVALDIDSARCDRLTKTLSRLNLEAHVIAADASVPESWWDGTMFDAILLDAPCTASGIVRRHPDIRWLRRESDISQLAKVQAQLLNTLWPLLKRGGRLLYSTCSVFRAEGRDQVETFLAHNTGARLLPSPGHLLPGLSANGLQVSDNLSGEQDGFFYALLEKSM